MNNPASMGKRAASGAIYVGISQGTRVILSTVSTIVVARILSPSDYGVMAMVSPIVGFLSVFQTMGLSQAVVQKGSVNDDQLNALFWLNIAASTVIALLLVLISPLVARFYNDPRVMQVTIAFAGTTLVSGLALQHSALLSRNMKFSTVSIIDIITAVVAFAATIAGAYLIHTYWALWIGIFLGAITNTALLWIAERWRPRFRISFRDTRELAEFGAHLTGFSLLNFISRNIDNVLIARFSGAEALGLYDRSYRLMVFPLQNINTPLSRVMIPILSRLQDEPSRYRRSFLLAFRLIMVAIAPAMAVAMATSDRLVPFLLGNRWAAAGPIFFWLSLSGLIQPIANVAGWLFISSGRARAMMWWGVLSSIVTVASIIVGLRWGAVGVAAAYCLTDFLIRTPSALIMSTKDGPVSLRDMLSVTIPCLLGAALTWSFLFAVGKRIHSIEALLALGLIFSYGSTIALNLLSSNGRQSILTVLELGQKWMVGLRQRRA